MRISSTSVLLEPEIRFRAPLGRIRWFLRFQVTSLTDRPVAWGSLPRDSRERLRREMNSVRNRVEMTQRMPLEGRLFLVAAGIHRWLSRP